jgi:hypothetical protein
VSSITPLAVRVIGARSFSGADFPGGHGPDHPRIRWRDDCDRAPARSVITMKRAPLFASLIAVAFLPACMLEVDDDPHGGNWNGGYGGGAGRGGTGSGGPNTWKNPDGGVSKDGPKMDGPKTPDSGGMTRSPDGSTKPPAPPPDAAPPPPPPPAPDAGAPASPEPICRHSGQCVSGRCQNGACQRPCTSDDSCGTGDICAEGFCQPDPKPGDECVYSVECENKGVCLNGRCHEPCTADDDCSNSADRCDRGLCRPDVRPIPQCTSNAQCPSDRTCVDAVCRNPCRDDSQCGPNCSGTVCSNGFCFMPEELVPPVCMPTPSGCGTPGGCAGTCSKP